MIYNGCFCLLFKHPVLKQAATRYNVAYSSLCTVATNIGIIKPNW